MYFSLVSPLDQNPGLELKPYFHLKNHHDLLCVFDLEAAPNSLDFFQQRTVVATQFQRLSPMTPKEWEKLEKISAWDLTKVRSKKEVIDEAKVHFASLMDICHLKKAEFCDKAPKIQRSSCTPR